MKDLKDSKIAQYSLQGIAILFWLLVANMFIVIPWLNVTYQLFALADFVIRPIMTLFTLALGWLIDRKYPGHRIAFLLLIVAHLSAILIVLAGLDLLALARWGQLSPAMVSISLTLSQTLPITLISILIFAIPLYFPSGNLPSPRWRWVVGIYLFILVHTVLAAVLLPWPDLKHNIMGLFCKLLTSPYPHARVVPDLRHPGAASTFGAS